MERPNPATPGGGAETGHPTEKPMTHEKGEMGSMHGAADRTMEMVNRDLTDDELAQRIHMINQHEAQMAQIAEAQATSRDVKDFARKLVKDHQNADRELTEVAKKMNINLSSQSSEEMHEKFQSKLDELKSMTGPDFDRHFLIDMQAGHNMAILMLTAQAYMHPIGKELRDYIKKSLPTLENHRRDSIRLLEKESSRTQQAS
jgi:putative membrane protein